MFLHRASPFLFHPLRVMIGFGFLRVRLRGEVVVLAPTAIKRRFQLVLIKPSHYDDDGYVIQWRRSSIPSNSLACVYALARDAAERRVLGRDVEIDITALDETNTRVKPTTSSICSGGTTASAWSGWSACSRTSFRARMDIARPLRAAGMPVVIGGFHVSGCLAMLPEMPADLQEALDLGFTPVRRRGRRRGMDEVLRDAAAGTLKPIYNYHERPARARSRRRRRSCRARPSRACSTTTRSFDAGRGCPFQCSFCTIINVQGRKSRRRIAGRRRAAGQQHWAQGIRRFFITDDNFARNKDWEDDLRPADQDARARQDRHPADHPGRHAVPQDPELHREGARAPACTQVFIGLENINPDNLLGRQEAAEQDHRISQDAARLEERRRASPMPATSSASRTTRRNRFRRTSRSSSRSCRSISWSSSA